MLEIYKGISFGVGDGLFTVGTVQRIDYGLGRANVKSRNQTTGAQV